MPSTSDQPGTPAIVADDISVGFLIRYHRNEVTLRETFVRLVDRLRPRRDQKWQERFWALRNVSLDVHPGEVVALIGRNGSGKSTMLKTLAGIIHPDQGSVSVRGRVGCLMSFGVGFKPNLSGRENVFINGSILGLPEAEIRERLDAIIDFSELGEFIDAPVRTYSAGMKGRLGFAVAVNIDPDVLLLDEVLTVGDAGFKAKAGSLLDRFRANNRTVVIATHSMSLVKQRCTRAIWLDRGQIRAVGAPEELAEAYTAATNPAAANTAAEPRKAASA